jgi:hypothetical protein
MPIATRRLGFESVNHHAGSQFAAKSRAALHWTIKPIAGIHLRSWDLTCHLSAAR